MASDEVVAAVAIVVVVVAAAVGAGGAGVALERARLFVAVLELGATRMSLVHRGGACVVVAGIGEAPAAAIGPGTGEVQHFVLVMAAVVAHIGEEPVVVDG